MPDLNHNLDRGRDLAARFVVPALLVLLIPFLVAVYIVDHQSKVRSYRSQVAACDRGNVLRHRINVKFAVYDTAMEETAKALKAAPKQTPLTKRLYDVFYAAAVTSPEALPLTDCAAVYDRPLWFWQRTTGERSPEPSGLQGPTGGGKG